MKKLLFTLFLMVLGTSAFAQKSYINVAAYDLTNDYQYLYISGDIPSDMKKYYDQKDNVTIGNILNSLAEKGYEVDYMSSLNSGTGSDRGVNYLLSKKTSNTSNAIQRILVDPDEEVTEVARYNLQGMPINNEEKGIQIVVYSNYTTKTIIVE